MSSSSSVNGLKDIKVVDTDDKCMYKNMDYGYDRVQHTCMVDNLVNSVNGCEISLRENVVTGELAGKVTFVHKGECLTSVLGKVVIGDSVENV